MTWQDQTAEQDGIRHLINHNWEAPDLQGVESTGKKNKHFIFKQPFY